MSTQDKPYLSPSQLDMFGRCPAQYKFRYIDGLIIPPGIKMLAGIGVHAGAETNFRQKIETHEDLPSSQIVEAAVVGFESRYAADGCVFTQEETSRGTKKVVGETKDLVAGLARVHAAQQAPEYQPVAVEHTIRIPLPNASRDLLGVIDLVDDRDIVTDFKTAGKKKSQAEADVSIQGTVYSAAFQREFKRPAKEFRLDVLTTGKKCERQVVTSTRTQADFVALANRINVVLAAIEAGNFPPTFPGNWACGPTWCGYFASGKCPYVNTERITKADGE